MTWHKTTIYTLIKKRPKTIVVLTTWKTPTWRQRPRRRSCPGGCCPRSPRNWSQPRQSPCQVQRFKRGLKLGLGRISGSAAMSGKACQIIRPNIWQEELDLANPT